MAGKSKPEESPAGRDQAQAPRRRATTIATEGRIVLAEGSANSRLFIYLAGNYLQRVERERREIYYGNLDLALVAEIIGIAGVEPGMRDAAFRRKHNSFDSIVGIEGQRAMNATSISIAAGMSRQTVRRRLKELLKLGFIVEKEPARYVLKPGVLQEPHRQAAFARVTHQTVRFINDLLEHGAVRWVPAGRGGQSANKR